MFENLMPLYELDDHENPTVTYHFTNPQGCEWWVCAGEKLPHDNDWYLFGVARIFEKEMGFMTLSQIKESRGELDDQWEPTKGLYDILEE